MKILVSVVRFRPWGPSPLKNTLMTPRKGIRRLRVAADPLWHPSAALNCAHDYFKWVFNPLLHELTAPCLGPANEPAIDQNEGSNALYCS